MYKRRNKPDLMFMLTVFVCLGVLVTSTLNAADRPGWGLAINDSNDCQQGLGEWQACSRWQAIGAPGQAAPQRAAVRFFNEQRPQLGVIWYYAQDSRTNSRDIKELGVGRNVAGKLAYATDDYFGLAVRQQYRQFGFSVGLESDNALFVDDNARLYFGLSNHW